MDKNANILTACVSWAEVLNAKAIFIGVVSEDSSGYPDCRLEFFKAFEPEILLAYNQFRGKNLKPNYKVGFLNKIFA